MTSLGFGDKHLRDELLNAEASWLFKVSERLSRSVQVGVKHSGETSIPVDVPKGMLLNKEGVRVLGFTIV